LISPLIPVAPQSKVSFTAEWLTTSCVIVPLATALANSSWIDG
jgi:hypothetical protein